MERARKKVTDEEQNNVDRLSDLPDICRHILSFLSTKESVQTSVLAKKWRFLWAHVPVIDLQGEDAMKTTTTFSGIVCTVLLRHEAQNLNTFRLTYRYDRTAGYQCNDDAYELERCIDVAVKRNVKNLHLERLRVRVELPRCLLTCQTLINLILESDVSIPPTAPISLPNLKKLHFSGVHCEVNFTRLLSGCPVIEELIIVETCADPRGCCISSPTLKRLTILGFGTVNNTDYMVTIYAPALTYLEVCDKNCERISISLCSSLVEAVLSFFSLCELDDFERQCVLKFLDWIRHVKCLHLESYDSEPCGGLKMPGSTAKFPNLTKLGMRANFCFLSKFLQSADHLQVLIISCAGFEDWEHWMDPIEEPSECLLHSIRTVRINDFSCTEQGFNMVRYILGNALVLEGMEIYWSGYPVVGLEQKSDATQRISLFDRGSVGCELSFSGD